MAKNERTSSKTAKTGAFVVGRKAFSKISAVEGITLTAGMDKRASEAKRKGMSAEEYRANIMRSHRKG